MANGKVRPRFVDLFFAVVIGTSFSIIKLDNDLIDILAKLFLILVIIEDWYGYYMYVVPVDSAQEKYNLLSLVIEFSILISWYFTISSTPDKILLYSIFFSIYFLFRFLGGLIMFIRGMVKFKYFVKEFSFFAPILLVWFAYFGIKAGCFSNQSIYILSFIGWLIHISIWWLFRKSRND
jgi:hypothetical protein